MTKHQSALVMVATAVDEHRRLTDDRLDALSFPLGSPRPARPPYSYLGDLGGGINPTSPSAATDLGCYATLRTPAGLRFR
jgi:hypothetical protein